MRHFGSFLLAAVFTPAIFLLTGTGLSAFGTSRQGTFGDDPLSTLAALGALLLAGLLYGILAMVRLSPVGPGLAGMALMGTSGWALVSPGSYDDSFAQVDVHMGGAVGQIGLGILLGVPLLATLTSPRRWRKESEGPYPQYYAGAQAAAPQRAVQPDYLTLPDVAAPSLRYPAAAPPALPKRVAAPVDPTVKITSDSDDPTRPLF